MHSSLETSVPERIGPYRITDVIGRGGMGVVFRAQHEVSGAPVALKKVVVAGDVPALRGEIDALRRLDHDGVVRITDQGIADGQPWYAMELLEGETLADYNTSLWRSSFHGRTEAHVAGSRATTPMGEKQSLALCTSASMHSAAADPTRAQAACGQLPFALTVIRRLCLTLSFVHGEGIVHRDIKSENVLLCADGMPKLLDFGLVLRFAGAAGREVLDLGATGSAGTAGYMAPEQIRGELVDARADLYALGCVLYELLTGRLPFDGGCAAVIRAQQLSNAPRPPSFWVDGVSSELDDLVLTLLEKRPEKRFGHASEVARQLLQLGALAGASETHTSQRSYVYRSTLVGRDEPLSTLNEHVKRALQGDGGVVALSGESGIGKTYLAMFAARQAEERGMNVISGSSVPIGASDSVANDALLHPFRGLLLAVADRCLGSAEMTARLLGERAKVLAACQPSLASLPTVAGYPEPEPLPAQATQQRLLAALADTMAAFSRACPLMLLLDDLQWADELSLSFLSSLPTDWFEGQRLMIVAVYRADEETAALRALQARPYTQRIALPSLEEPAVAELVRGMLAIDTPPTAFVEQLARQSQGNPFFVAEYLRAAVAEQLLSRASRGNWQIDQRLLEPQSDQRALQLPNTIAELVGRRVNGLSLDAKRLLSVAAVLGSELSRELLLSMAELSEEQGWQPLHELITRQFLEEVPDSSSPRTGNDNLVRFSHDKLREAAYQQIPAAVSVMLHGRAIDAIERRCRGKAELVLVYATLAHHAERAGQLSRALRYLELAGDHALATYANRDAIGHFTDALALDARGLGAAVPADGKHVGRCLARKLRHLDAVHARRASWERKLAQAHYALGDLQAVNRHIVCALQHVGHAPPRSTLGWVAAALRDIPRQVMHRTRPSRHVALSPIQREVLTEAALAMHYLAERHYYDFNAVPMVSAGLRSVNLAERADITSRIAKPYAMLGMAAGISGFSALGERYFSLARQAAQVAADDAGMVYALYAQAAWRIGHGAFSAVRSLCDEGVTIAVRIRDVKALGMAQTLLGHADFYTSHFEASVRIYGELEQAARRSGDRQHLSWGLYSGARALICLGEFEKAQRMLTESNALLETLVEVPSRIIAPGLLASLHLRTGDMTRALEAANLTTSRIRENHPTVFATVSGYAGAAEVFLAHYERLSRGAATGRMSHARATVRRAVRDLSLLALNIPLARPCYHRLRGEAQRLSGDTSAARRSFDRSLKSACALSMPYEAALTHIELARTEAVRSAPRREHLLQAEQMLEGMGCRYELERVRQTRDNSLQ
jgi:eukaryotic-like serine/threonine-protein kinase